MLTFSVARSPTLHSGKKVGFGSCFPAAPSFRGFRLAWVVPSILYLFSNNYSLAINNFIYKQCQVSFCVYARANSHNGGHAVKDVVVQFDEKVNYLQTSSIWLFLKCHPEERPLLSWRGDLAEAPLSIWVLSSRLPRRKSRASQWHKLHICDKSDRLANYTYNYVVLTSSLLTITFNLSFIATL